MLNLTQIKEGMRIYRRARRIKKHGFPKYQGNAKQICTEIVKKCFNGTYFQVSLGHFSEFYIRDFGICCESLVKLGYRTEVLKTLQYALNIYSSNNILTTTITPDHKPVNIYAYSPDSLPFLLRSLRVAGAGELIEVYQPFLQQQIDYYFEHVLNQKAGLVRIGDFSSMKDNFRRQSSCYDNCMLSMLSDEIDALKFSNPFSKYNLKENIRACFWNRKYFYDDIKKHKYVAGDANVFPFWCKVFDDKEMFGSCLSEIQKNRLDKPFPLKYTNKQAPSKIIFPLNLILPDYETNTIWMHLGLCFLDVVKRYDKKLFKKYLAAYTDVIEKNANFLELFSPDGKQYIRPLYAADDSMLWAAIYLDLIS